jgi:hypothetical protein
MNGDNPSNPPEKSPPAVIPYATPVGLGPDQPDFGCWRRGDRVIVTRTGASLPPICFKCGRPTERYKLLHFTWCHPLFYLLAPTVILFAIVVLCVQEKAEVNIPICERHYRTYRNWIITFCLVVLAGAGIGLGVARAYSDSRHTNDFAAIALIVFLGVFCVTGIIVNCFGRIAQAKRIDGRCVHLGGAGEQFLNHLPSA